MRETADAVPLRAAMTRVIEQWLRKDSARLPRGVYGTMLNEMSARKLKIPRMLDGLHDLFGEWFVSPCVLLLIERARVKIPLRTSNVHMMLLVASIISAKMLDDECYNDSAVGQAFHIEMPELMRQQFVFLDACQFRTHMHSDDVMRMSRRLVALQLKQSMKRVPLQTRKRKYSAAQLIQQLILS